MSLALNLGTKPEGLEIKTWGDMLGPDPLQTIHLGEYEISMVDFLYAAAYVLTNTNLEKNDPRLQFVEYIRAMKVIEGYHPGGKRLKSDVPPVPEASRLAKEGRKEAVAIEEFKLACMAEEEFTDEQVNILMKTVVLGSEEEVVEFCAILRKYRPALEKKLLAELLKKKNS